MSPRAACQGCRRSGVYREGAAKQRWCRCSKRAVGPYVAPKGQIVCYVFEAPLSPAEQAIDTEAREVRAEYYAAKDAPTYRYVRCGRGWRELSETSPKRLASTRRWEAAVARVEELQGRCPHLDRWLMESSAWSEERGCVVPQHTCSRCMLAMDPRPGVVARLPGMVA